MLPPLVPGGGANSLAREGVGESQLRRGDIHYGTLYTYVLCDQACLYTVQYQILLVIVSIGCVPAGKLVQTVMITSASRSTDVLPTCQGQQITAIFLLCFMAFLPPNRSCSLHSLHSHITIPYKIVALTTNISFKQPEWLPYFSSLNKLISLCLREANAIPSLVAFIYSCSSFF